MKQLWDTEDVWTGVKLFKALSQYILWSELNWKIKNRHVLLQWDLHALNYDDENVMLTNTNVTNELST